MFKGTRISDEITSILPATKLGNRIKNQNLENQKNHQHGNITASTMHL
jgi:hypothetical protein